MKYNINLEKCDFWAVDQLIQELSYLLLVNPDEFIKRFFDIDFGKITPNDTQLLAWKTMTDMTKLRILDLPNNHYKYFMNIPMIGVTKGEVEYVK